MTVLRIRDGMVPNAKQIEFSRLCDSTPAQGHIGIGGSIRAGKSQVGARKIVAWAWRYGGDYIVARKTYRQLADSTRKVFLYGDGGLPAACPTGRNGLGEWRASDEEIRLRNGAKIMFRSLENADDAINNIKNVTLAGYMIDQVEELDGEDYEEVFNTFNGRLSDQRGPRKGITVSNPGPEDHWYHYRVVDAATRERNYHYVHVTLFDNEPNLPSEYVEQMKATKETRPDWYRRYILGEWGAFGGKRFKIWDPKIHVVDQFDIPRDWEIVEGGDYGWANPFVWLWVAIDWQNRYVVFAEHAASETKISDHAAGIKQIRERYNVSPSSAWLDPAAWAKRGEFESPAMELADHGILAGKAQNDRLGGWNRIEEMLSTIIPDWDDPSDRSKATPQLVLMRGRAPMLQKELPNLRIKDGTDDVEKANDHASDALRYIVSSRPPPPRKPEKDRHEEYLERKLARMGAEREEALYGT